MIDTYQECEKEKVRGGLGSSKSSVSQGAAWKTARKTKKSGALFRANFQLTQRLEQARRVQELDGIPLSRGTKFSRGFNLVHQRCFIFSAFCGN